MSEIKRLKVRSTVASGSNSNLLLSNDQMIKLVAEIDAMEKTINTLTENLKTKTQECLNLQSNLDSNPRSSTIQISGGKFRD